MINNALNGKKLPVYGDGKNVRDWLYVEDHCKAIDLVQQKGRDGETYNIGGHNEKQNIEIVETIIDVLREYLPDTDPRKAHITKDLIEHVTDRKGHDRRYAIAPDKIKAELGWEPETMFKEGIRKTIVWYMAYTFDLARLLVDMILSEKYGYYHATNEGGYISWYDFTVEIYKQAGYSTKVIPVTTAEYGLSKAKRPFNSRLEKGKLVANGFTPLPTWQDALHRYLEELKRADMD